MLNQLMQYTVNWVSLLFQYISAEGKNGNFCDLDLFRNKKTPEFLTLSTTK